ncbi:TPA: hypothetical protein NGR52_004222 [Vibrio parahaemolyticus]|nr:hypothetical protein [Vibrio parahaemolyticus]
MTNKQIPIVAVDEGSSRVKLAFLTEDEKISCHITPSLAQRGKLTTKELEYHKGGYTIEGGETLTITDNTETPISNQTAEKYQVSDVNLVATHYALSEAGFGGKDVSIITSLPVDMFFNSPDSDTLINTDLIEAKKKNLMRKVVPVRPDVKAANIVDVKVCPEAVTAFSDLVSVDENGKKATVYPYESFVVFDFGESTLDVTLIQGDGTVTNERFSSNHAVKRVIQILNKKIAKQFDIELSHATGAQVLRAGKFHGQDVSEHIQSAVDHVFADIELKVVDEIPSLRKATRVYSIGGGAHIFTEKLKTLHKRVVMPKLPEITLVVSMLTAAGGQPIKGMFLED